jgi:hypothetical protein
MAARFVPINRDAPLLLSPNLRDWIPVNHLVHFIFDTVAGQTSEEWESGKNLPQHGRPKSTLSSNPPNLQIKNCAAPLYLAWVHPFGGGNGRTARLLEFHILLSAAIDSEPMTSSVGFVPVEGSGCRYWS